MKKSMKWVKEITWILILLLYDSDGCAYLK